MWEYCRYNAIKCLKCDTVIESKAGWDFKMCPCGTVGVDGGVGPSAIVRRIGHPSNYEDLSVWSNNDA